MQPALSRLRGGNEGVLRAITCMALDAATLRAVAGAAEGTIQWYNAAICEPLAGTHVHAGPVVGVAFHDAGRAAISLGQDRNACITTLGEAKSRQLFGLPGRVFQFMSLTTDLVRPLALAVSFDRHVLQVWDIERQTPVYELRDATSRFRQVELIPGDQAVVLAEGSRLGIWSLRTGACTRWLDTPLGVDLTCIKAWPERDQVLAGDSAGVLRSFDLRTSAVRSFDRSNDRAIKSIMLDRVNRLAVTTSVRRSLQIHHLETGECLTTWEGKSALTACAVINAVAGATTYRSSVADQARTLISTGDAEGNVVLFEPV